MIQPWFNFAVALAIGLLIGLERERSKGEGPTRRPAGIRTFALASLLGAIAIHLGGATLLAVATAAMAMLIGLSYIRGQDPDPGLTTEVGLLISPLLGALAMSDGLLSASLGAAVAVILAIKAPVHRFVKGVLSEAEVNDGFVFAIATLVIWPQLPDHYVGPWKALNPHTLWLLVILVMAIGASGYVALRLLGPRYGLPISGLASGFVSSTATIGSMAARVGKDPTAMAAAVAGAALSTVATYVQMALLLYAISTPTLATMSPSLLAGGTVAALYGGFFTLRALKSQDTSDPDLGRAFSVKSALVLATTMAAMLVVAAALKELLGEAGIVVGAAVAGIVDTHAAAISVASLAASANLTPKDAVLPILTAMTSNTLAKSAMAIGAGSREFSMRTIPGLVLSMAAAWAAALPVIAQ
jgi:uncharacterized membrane protein (DUF4010 family)